MLMRFQNHHSFEYAKSLKEEILEMQISDTNWEVMEDVRWLGVVIILRFKSQLH